MLSLLNKRFNQLGVTKITHDRDGRRGKWWVGEIHRITHLGTSSGLPSSYCFCPERAPVLATPTCNPPGDGFYTPSRAFLCPSAQSCPSACTSQLLPLGAMGTLQANEEDNAMSTIKNPAQMLQTLNSPQSSAILEKGSGSPAVNYPHK